MSKNDVSSEMKLILQKKRKKNQKQKRWSGKGSRRTSCICCLPRRGLYLNHRFERDKTARSNDHLFFRSVIGHLLPNSHHSSILQTKYLLILAKFGWVGSTAILQMRLLLIHLPFASCTGPFIAHKKRAAKWSNKIHS